MNMQLYAAKVMNAGSRNYAMEDDSAYKLFSMLLKEISFGIDVCKMPCGTNSAIYVFHALREGHSLLVILQLTDQDGDHMISKQEIDDLLVNPQTSKTLEQVDTGHIFPSDCKRYAFASGLCKANGICIDLSSTSSTAGMYKCEHDACYTLIESRTEQVDMHPAQ